jgi:hypothetical protein
VLVFDAFILDDLLLLAVRVRLDFSRALAGVAVINSDPVKLTRSLGENM